MIRAIFFDFDGVLVDSEPLHLECWAAVLADYGVPLTAETYFTKFIGVSNREMIETLCRESGKRFTAEFFEQCYERKKVIFQDRAPRECHTPPELLAFIRERSKDYRMAVVSSSSRCEVEPHLVGQGIRESIEALVCLEDVQRVKPAPDPYLRALELVNDGAGSAGAILPEDCLVVEDSGPGADAGLAAGMQVLVVGSPGDVAGRLRLALGY